VCVPRETSILHAWHKPCSSYVLMRAGSAGKNSRNGFPTPRQATIVASKKKNELPRDLFPIRVRAFCVRGARLCAGEGGFSGAGGVMMCFCAMGRKKPCNFCRSPRAPVAVHGTGTVKSSNGVKAIPHFGVGYHAYFFDHIPLSAATRDLSSTLK
jgi:hypothetical protein